MSNDSGRGGKKRSTLLVIVAILAFAIIGVVFVQVYRYRSLEDTIRAKNEPLTMAALDAWYPDVPEERNAAVVVQRAAGMVVEPARDALVPFLTDCKLDGHGVPLTEEIKAATRDALEANKAAIALATEAAAMPESKYDNFVGTTTGTSSHLPHVRQLCRLQVLQAVAQADAGDFSGAAKGLENAIALGESLKNEPLLISQLVRFATVGPVFKGTDFLLNRGVSPDDALKSLQARLESAEDQQALYRAMVGERCFMSSSALFGTRVPLSGLFKVSMQSVMTDVVDASALPEEQRRARFVDLDQEYKARFEASILPWSAITYGFVPGLLGSAEPYDTSTAQLRVAATAIAVERFRIAEGKLPASLDELSPMYLATIPVDPFDATPLRFAPRDAGFVVYSVGVDGVDGEGVEADTEGRRSNRRSGDVVMAVVR